MKDLATGTCFMSALPLIFFACAWWWPLSVHGFYPHHGYDEHSYDYRSHAEKLRHRFDEMKHDYPMPPSASGEAGLLPKILSTQDEMIKIVEISGEFLSSIDLSGRGSPGDFGHYYYGHEHRYHHADLYDFESERMHNANLGVFIDVVFVGYPATALQVIKENWFDNLGRKDDFLVRGGPFGDILSSSALDGGAFGETTISYHFNLIQISFQVADAIRNRLNLFSQKLDDHSEVNAWEMEATLESLRDVIAATHTKNATSRAANPFAASDSQAASIQPTATIFILNLDLHSVGEDPSPSSNKESAAKARHKYRPGFSEEELQVLAGDADIIKLCEEALLNRNPPSLVEDVSKPLHLMVEDILQKRIDPEGHRYRGYYDYSRFEEQQESLEGVNWRDAKIETKKWATALDDETLKIAQDSLTIQKQALRILKAVSGHPLSRFRLELASAVLEMQADVNSSKEKARPKSRYHPSGTWVGASRLIWKDMNAITDLPNNRERQWMHTTSAITPKPLSEAEWLKIGDHSPHSLNRNMQEEIAFLSKTIRRRYDTSRKLHAESMCNEFLPQELREKGHRNSSAYVEAVLQYINHKFEVDFTVDSCSYLSFELTFMDAILNIGIELVTIYDQQLSRPDAVEYKDVARESLQLLLKLLSISIDFCNVFLDSDALSKIQTELGDTHVSILSEEAVMYLSYVAGTVLDITRQFVSPPMQLRQHRNLIGSGKNSKNLAQSGLSQQHVLSESLSEAAGLLPPRVQDLFLYFNDSGIPAFNEWQNLFDFVVRSVEANNPASTTERHHFMGTSNKAYLEGCSADEESPHGEAATDEMRSYVQNMVHWSLAYPAIVAPTKIDISIYLIRLQDTYDPFATYSGDYMGFDFITLKEELMRLALPNQEMGISTHQIRASDEPALAVSLHSCGRHAATRGTDSTSRKVHLNVRCVLSYVEHFDEENYAPYADDIKSHHNANNDFRTKHYKSTLHIPIYVLSTDSESPVYLDSNQQVSVDGNSIVIVQNKHLHLPSPLAADSSQSGLAGDISEDAPTHVLLGRNPIAPTLQAVGDVIGGLPPSHVGHRGAQTTLASLSSLHNLESHLKVVNGDSGLLAKTDYCSIASLKSTMNAGIISINPNALMDWTKALGNSPMFDAAKVKIPRFSELDVEFIHRSRILRTISVSRTLAQEEIAAFQERSKVAAIQAKHHGRKSPYDSVLVYEVVEAYEHRFNNMIDQALYFASVKDWANAMAFANAIYFVSIYAADYLKAQDEPTSTSDTQTEQPDEVPSAHEMKKNVSPTVPDSSWINSIIEVVVDFGIWPFMSCGLSFGVVKAALFIASKLGKATARQDRLSPSGSYSATYRFQGESMI